MQAQHAFAKELLASCLVSGLKMAQTVESARKALAPLMLETPIAEASAESIQTLLSDARHGNELAIESLNNISLRKDEAGVLAQHAIGNLYADPDTSEHVRARLRVEAFGACELVLNDEATAKSLSLSLTFPVVYLGGQYAQERPVPAMEEKIEQHIAKELSLPEGALNQNEKLLDSGRLVRQDELRSFNATLESLTIHEQVLDPWNRVDFEKQRNQIQGALSNGCTVGAWIYTNEHWLPAVFHKDPYGTTHCWLLDSNKSDNDHVQPAINALLTSTTVWPREETMQENAPNACALLGMRLFKLLDDLNKDENGGPLDPEKIEEAINSFVESWQALNADQQRASVTILRAKSLANWAAANSAHAFS